MNFFNTNNAFTVEQYGLRENRSTTDTITELINKITNDLNNCNDSATVIMDLSKALNCVNKAFL